MSTVNQLYNELLKKLTQTENVAYSNIVCLINNQSYKELNLYLKKEKVDLNDKMGAKICLLSYCVCLRNLEAIKLLVKFGANVNYYDPNPPQKFSHYPILEDSICEKKILNFLLKSGMNVKNEFGQKILEKALDMYQSTTPILLMKYGAPYENIDLNKMPSYVQLRVPKIFADFTIKREKLLLENSLNSPTSKLKIKI